MKILKTIDAHVGGQTVRLVVDGFPAPQGRDMWRRQQWAARHCDHLRSALMREPRGHVDLTGAVLTEPVTAGAHAGLLFMNAAGYRPMSGHGIVGATAIALERGLLSRSDEEAPLVFDTVAGAVAARVRQGSLSRGTEVSFRNVPAFVLHGALTVSLPSRRVPVDVAFGGAFHAVVDSEAAGLGMDLRLLPELRRTAAQIASAVELVERIEHPLDARIHGLHGVVFTGPAAEGAADLRTQAVLVPASADRSPSGTGMSAVLAVLDAMGVIEEGASLLCESLIGTRFRGRVTGRTTVGRYEAIVTEIEGSAWITGEHLFLIHPDDPLRDGILV